MKKRGIHIVYFILFTTALYCIFFLDKGDNIEENTGLYKGYKIINKELSIIDNEDVNKWENVKNTDKSIKLVYELDKEYPDGYSLVLKTEYQNLEIYIDEKKIYEYNDSITTKSWHDIKLTPDYFGKKMTIVYKDGKRTDKNKILENNFYCGDFINIMINEIKGSFLEILFSIVLCVSGIILLCLYILKRRKKRGRKALYVASIAIITAIQIFLEIGLVQTFLENDTIVNVITYELLYVALIILVKFIGECYRKKMARIYNQMAKKLLVILIFTNIIFWKFEMNFYQISNVGNVFMILASIFVIISYVYDKIFENKFEVNIGKLSSKKHLIENNTLKINEKYIKLNICFIIIPLFLDIYLWYAKYNIMQKDFLFLDIGIIVYVLMVAADTLENVRKMILLGKQTLKLEELARQDTLTKVGSRRVYAEYITRLNKDKTLCYNKMIISFDVNDLKVINDNFGHNAGDKYLVDCVQIIKEVFEGCGECYRIGGDEFIVIIDDYDEEIFNNCKEKMKEKLIFCKRESDNKPISIAYGYAKFDDKLDNGILDTVKRADAMMYRRKNNFKNKKKDKENFHKKS